MDRNMKLFNVCSTMLMLDRVRWRSLSHVDRNMKLFNVCSTMLMHSAFHLPGSESLGVNPALVLHGFSLAILSTFMVEVSNLIPRMLEKWPGASCNYSHSPIIYPTVTGKFLD